MTVEILHSGFDGLRLTIETDVTPALRLSVGLKGGKRPFAALCAKVCFAGQNGLFQYKYK